MKDLLKIVHRFFDKDLDFRVRLFNILAIAGIIVSISTGLLGVLINAGLLNLLLNTAAAVLAAVLLYFSQKTGRYQLCYIITVIAVFLLLFAFLFFSAGGYHSGMPVFFVFAVCFTVFMLDVKKAIVFSLIELALYTSLCLIAYFYPETVNAFDSEADILGDILISVLSAGAVLGITMILHFRIYIRQQEKLVAQNKRLMEIDEMKSTFLTTVAHEIKNPLAVISVHARDTSELLDEQPQDIVLMKENLQTIERVVMRIDQIVLDLMDTVSIEQGRLALSLAPMHLSSLLHESCKTYFGKSDASGNTLTLDLEESLPPLTADYARLLQVMSNLLSNASRHTKNGEITVSLKAYRNRQLVVIADNGEGMDERMSESALEGYVSVDKEYWRHGIGLYVCRQIITAHGGEIWIESELGKGTKVSFTLPVDGV